MLYLDQPTQVGFSYDTATNGTRVVWEEDGVHWETIPTNFTETGIPETNLTYHYGTFASQDLSKTANTTAFAAHALWHFAQAWFFEFPYYKPNDNRISLWGESYGGHYGPGIFRLFQEQNEKITNGSSPEKNAQYIHLDTLGIVNGLIDVVIAYEAWISFPFNNVSGLHLHEFDREVNANIGNRHTASKCSTSLYTRDLCTTGLAQVAVRKPSSRARRP